ncbi:MAG: MFS transporter [Pseudomonadales bacterium]|nr:MFS transporter [Pseudomonadales bacterium]
MKDQNKPSLSLWQIWNMCFGFLGIQYGFGLQQANLSPIFRYHGASESELPILWLAGPVTGLLIQPLIGVISDRTWTRFGRRKPFFLFGALIGSIAVMFMPYVPALWMVVGLFWILDASMNTAMEPYRALIGDNLNHDQRPLGFAVQSVMIAVGQMLAGLMPMIMIFFGVSAETDGSTIPDIVKYAFLVGVVTMLLASAWSYIKTEEYPPAQDSAEQQAHQGSGIAGTLKELWRAIVGMPPILRKIWWVQLFTWYGLPLMWQYLALSIARHSYGAPTPESPGFAEGTAQVGMTFTIMNITTLAVSFLLPRIILNYGESRVYATTLVIGGLGFISMVMTNDLTLTLLAMIPVGIAWAGIITVPYVITANAVPATHIGVYMGILNAFVCIPQILMMLTFGAYYEALLQGDPRLALVFCGACFIMASLLALRIGSTPLHQPDQLASVDG